MRSIERAVRDIVHISAWIYINSVAMSKHVCSNIVILRKNAASQQCHMGSCFILRLLADSEIIVHSS